MPPSASVCAATPGHRVLLGLLGARPAVRHGLPLLARPRFLATSAPAPVATWRLFSPASVAVPVAAAAAAAAAAAGSSSGHSHHRSRQSGSSSSPVWCLAAAAVPFVTASPYDEVAYPQQTVQIEGTSSSSPRGGVQLPLNEQVVRQISKGSIAGFVLGLLVSTFSRSLVLFLGLALSVQSLAARVGIDLVQMLHLKERVRASKILTALSENTALKLSFGIAFTMSAFMRF